MEQLDKKPDISDTRLRLIAQNQKLHNQIIMLEQKMSQVITNDITQAVSKTRNSYSNGHSQLSMQQSYMRRLKNKINQLKSVGYIQVQGSGTVLKEQNELVHMKREYENLLTEKTVMKKQIETKKTALLQNNPLLQYKDQTADQMNKIKKINSEQQAKIVQLQRQIRKYHKYQQLNKAFKGTKIVVDNPQFELSKLDHEKNEWKKKARLIENKWKPQLEALDRQYFATREISIQKQKKLEEMEKQLRNWENRASAVRNEADVLNDRERISKIPQSPCKEEIKQQVSKEKKKQQNKLNTKKKPQQKKQGVSGLMKQLKDQINSKKSELKEDISPIEQISSNKKQYKYRQVGTDTKPEEKNIRHWGLGQSKQLSRYESRSQRIQMKHNDQYQRTRRSLKNQFIHSKQAFSGRQNTYLDMEIQKQNKKKKLLLLKSVAVGTSFYYDEQND